MSRRVYSALILLIIAVTAPLSFIGDGHLAHAADFRSLSQGTKSIKVGLIGHFRPAYHEYDALGNLYGVNIEFFINIAQQLGTIVTFQTFENSTIAAEALRNHQIDLLLDDLSNYKNQSEFSLSKPIYMSGLAVWYRDRSMVSVSPKKLTWACIEESVFCKKLVDSNVGSIKAVENIEQGIKIASQGEADAYLHYYPAMLKYLDDFDIKEGKVKIAHWRKTETAVAVVTNKNKWLADLISETVESDKHKALTKNELKPKSIYFTNGKKIFDYRRLNKNRALIRYSINDDMYPVFYRDSQGNLSGYVYEYIKLLESRSGLEFTYIPNEGRSLFQMMADDEIDLIPIVHSVDNIDNDYIVSDPYVQFNYVYVKRRDDLVDLINNEQSNETGVLVKTNALLSSMQSNSSDNLNLIYTDIKEILTDLDEGRISSAIMDEDLANTLILRNEEDKYQIIVDEEHPKSFTKASFGITNTKPMLSEVLTGAMKTVNARELEQIISSYQKFNVVYGYEKERVKLFIILGVLVFSLIILGIYFLVKYFKLQLNLKNQQMAVFEANHRAHEATEARSRFLATMSHELRTPIAGTIGLIEMLKDQVHSKEGKLLLENIDASCSNLHLLVNDILDYSKIDANKLKLENRKTDVIKVLGETLRLHNVTANEKNLGFVVNWQPSDIQFIEIDSLRLSQVLNNLLSNAIKFTSKGQIESTIELTSASLTITLEDTGVGMSEEQILKVFEPFTQADSSIARNYGGTGLGLSIVNKLVHLMKGSLKFDSTLNKGTTVELKVPFDKYWRYSNFSNGVLFDVNRSDENIIQWCNIFNLKSINEMHHEVIVSDDRNSSYYQKANKLIEIGDINNEFKKVVNDNHVILSSSPFYPDVLISTIFEYNSESDYVLTQDKKSICVNLLVAEDNPINRLLLEKQLTELGAKYTMVNDGAQALEMLSKSNVRYDLILTDYHMPNMDGITLAKRIRESENEVSKVKIICITAELSLEIEDGLQQGYFDDVLYKPYKIDELSSKCIDLIGEKEKNTDTPPEWLWLDRFSPEEKKNFSEIFIKTMSEDAVLVQKYLALGDATALRKITHRIKGGASALGVTGISDKAKKVEIMLNKNGLTSKINEVINEMCIEMECNIVQANHWLTVNTYE